MPAKIKITRLTDNNIWALKETLTPDELRSVTLGRTTAEFDMLGTDALNMVQQAQGRAGAAYGTRGHPYQSLHAVIRKLRYRD